MRILPRRPAIALIVAFLVSLPAVTPRLYSSDEIQYFSYLRSLWFDRDVSFENEYRYFYDRDIARAEGFHETFLEKQTDAGRRPNFGTIGCALLWAPFYGVGDLVARTMRRFGSPVAVDGFSTPYVTAVAYGSAFYGLAAVLLAFAAARSLNGSAAVATVAVWLGTPLLFYTHIAPPYSHACSAFAVALFVTIWLRIRDTWTARQTLVLGLAAALMAMVREQDVFFAIGPALDFALSALRSARAGSRRPVNDWIRAVATGCAAYAVAFLPQLLAYRALNGHLGPSRLVVRKMSWHAPHALEVLFSPSHGFFFWTPLAALAIAGLVLLTVRGTTATRRVGAIALLMVMLQVYVGGSVESWTVAGAFGQRRFVALTILLVIGFATLWTAAGHRLWRGALIGSTVLAVWWNLALIAQFGTGLMDRKRLELGRNAYHAFVTVPKTAPALAYRYLTNRESYYRPSDPSEDR